MTSVSPDIGMQNLRILEYYFSGCGLCCLLHEILRFSTVDTYWECADHHSIYRQITKFHNRSVLVHAIGNLSSEAPLEMLHYSNNDGRSLDVHKTTYYNYDPSHN